MKGQNVSGQSGVQKMNLLNKDKQNKILKHIKLHYLFADFNQQDYSDSLAINYLTHK